MPAARLRRSRSVAARLAPGAARRDPGSTASADQRACRPAVAGPALVPAGPGRFGFRHFPGRCRDGPPRPSRSTLRLRQIAEERRETRRLRRALPLQSPGRAPIWSPTSASTKARVRWAAGSRRLSNGWIAASAPALSRPIARLSASRRRASSEPSRRNRQPIIGLRRPELARAGRGPGRGQRRRSSAARRGAMPGRNRRSRRRHRPYGPWRRRGRPWRRARGVDLLGAAEEAGRRLDVAQLKRRLAGADQRIEVARAARPARGCSATSAVPGVSAVICCARRGALAVSDIAQCQQRGQSARVSDPKFSMVLPCLTEACSKLAGKGRATSRGGPATSRAALIQVTDYSGD